MLGCGVGEGVDVVGDGVKYYPYRLTSRLHKNVCSIFGAGTPAELSDCMGRGGFRGGGEAALLHARTAAQRKSGFLRQPSKKIF